MKVQVLLSMDATPLTDEQKQVVHGGGGEWEVIETTETRYLVHAIVDLESIDVLRGYLTAAGLSPVLIGVWDESGLLQSESNTAELANFSANAAQSHQFGGWEITAL